MENDKEDKDDSALWNAVKFQADAIENAFNGKLYNVEGSEEVIEDIDAWEEEHPDKDTPEQLSIYDVLSDSLGDIRFDCDSRKELHGGKVLMACGGPNIWVTDEAVKGYWGFEERTYFFSPEICNVLFAFFDEQFHLIYEV